MKRILAEILAERRRSRIRLVTVICALVALLVAALVWIAFGTAPWGPMPVRWPWQDSGYRDG